MTFFLDRIKKDDYSPVRNVKQVETRNSKVETPLPWASRLRNVATVLVIAIHVSAPVAQEHPDLNSSIWWAGNLWDALGRPSVNLFVMLSGFLLFDKSYSTGVFLKKRFIRVLIPSLFWMLIYLVYGHIANNDPTTLKAALIKLVEGPVHYHLWFVYLILGLYLMYPILRPWVQQARERDYWYFFAICILGTWVYKILVAFWGIKIGLYFELYTNQIGHFVLGYYLGNKVAAGAGNPHPCIEPWAFSRRQLIALGWTLVVVGMGATALGSYWHSTAQGGFQPFFYDYLTPTVTIGAVGWMLLARHSWNNRPLLEVESLFAAASFGIYLAHVIVMDWLSECGYWHSKVHPLKAIPIVVAMVVLLSFTFVLLLRAIPYGKKIA